MNNPPPVTTISGAIRRRLAEIEQRMYEGERQSDIVAQLNRDGIKVSLKDFRQLLSRARKARKELGEKQTQTRTTKAVETIINEPEKAPAPKNRNIPKAASSQPKNVEKKPTGKMSLADIDNLLRNPLDLDNL